MSKTLENELHELLSFVPGLSEMELSLPDSAKSKDSLFELDPEYISELMGENVSSFLTLCAALASRRITDKFRMGRRYTDAETEELLIGTFRGVFVESVYMISLDSDGRMLSCDFINDGTANYSDVVPMKMLERAKRRRAASVIIAHNHPLGDPTPSSADFTSTLIIKDMMREAGINLLAHYIIAGGKARKITPEMLSAKP